MPRQFRPWTTPIVVLAFAAIGMTAGAESVSPRAGPQAPRGLSATANGQVAFTIDSDRRTIMAGDLSKLNSWRDVVGPAIDGIPEPVAVCALPGDVVGAVCRLGDAWTLRTFRTAPTGLADPTSPLQEIVLGEGKGSEFSPALTVNHAFGWIAVAGLPRPLPPVLRAVVAGVRVGPLSDRLCPVVPNGYVPVAVTGSPTGDLVLVLRPASGDDEIGFYDSAGRELLRLSTQVRNITGIDFGRGDGLLWAVGIDMEGRDGLWRLDATLRGGRQEIRPIFIESFPSPRAVVSASERALIVTHGDPNGAVSRVDPAVVDRGDSRRPLP